MPVLLSLILLASVAGGWGLVSGAAASPLREPVATELLGFATRIEVVFVQSTIEGYPVSSFRFDTEIAPAQVLRVAREGWARGGAPEVVNASSGSWQLLSARDQQGYRTLQVKPRADGGTQGILSIWQVPSLAPAALEAAALLPAGAVVLRALGTVDRRAGGETVVAVIASGRAWVYDAIDASARARGFHRQRVDSAASRHADAEAIFYRRQGAELAITLVEGDGGTAIVIHRHESRP